MKEGFSPVHREIPYEPPHDIYAKIKSAQSIFLESLKGPEHIARYSFIGIEPYLVLKVKNGCVEIDCEGRKSVSFRKPLLRLRELLAAYPQIPVQGLPPFQGGAMGMLSYDFVRYLEKLPDNAVDDLDVPDAHFFMVDRLIAFDHRDEKCWIIVCPGARDRAPGSSGTGKSTRDSAAEAEREIGRLWEKIRVSHRDDAAAVFSKPVDIVHETRKERYMDMVEKAKEYIAAGDIFQANLSLRLSADIGTVSSWRVYEVLREINPSPFAAYVDFGDYQIASSSPERLVRVRDAVVDTRPIAGTRPRGRDFTEDEAMRADLLLNEKERAEHIMLIDLERNDLGKVCDYGTVTVGELMITEQYSHVMHIVSNIQGNLARGKDCIDVIRAAFPGGTITGVPKVRCMEIIEELEQRRRGPYTGSIGYVGFNGNMDLNIVIRTFFIRQGRAYVQAGAGIVADSDPEREYHESLKKAEALIRTLEKL